MAREKNLEVMKYLKEEITHIEDVMANLNLQKIRIEGMLEEIKERLKRK